MPETAQNDVFPLHVHRLNLHLGLPPLNHPPVCHGYVNGCRCEHNDCDQRSRHGGVLKAEATEPRQPWQPAGDELPEAA